MNIVSYNSRLLRKICKFQFVSATKRDFKTSKTCLSAEGKRCNKDTLLTRLSKKQLTCTAQKVSIIGMGKVGIACAICILAQKISNNICLVDTNSDLLKGEMLDILHGTCFIDDPKVTAGEDYAITAKSRICVICAGTRPKGKQTRLELLQVNADLIKDITTRLIKHSPDTIVVIVTNPVDILTWLTWKVSGLPASQVIGTGCSLDSARFKYMIAERLGIAPSACQAYIIGEHGPSCVPVWSGVNIAGMRLRDYNPNAGIDPDPDNWSEIHAKIVKAAYTVRMLKGCTSWAIGFSTARLVASILRNTLDAQCLSIPVKGFHGVKEDICLSLPTIVGEMGITDVVNLVLTPHETEMFQKSAKKIADAQKQLKM